MPVQPIFGSFLGVDPLNVVRYCPTPRRHILGWKHEFWRIDRADRSRNVRATKEAKKEKRDLTSHIFGLARPPTLRYPHQSCHVGGVSGVVSHAKFH